MSDDGISTTSSFTINNRSQPLSSQKINLYKLGDSVTVQAPATSANLGCGFDCFGMALDLWLSLTVTVTECFSYEHTGSSDPEISQDRTNDVVVVFMKALQHLKAWPPPGKEFSFKSVSNIPIGRGLGSSAAAIVAGLAAAFSICGRSLGCTDTLQEIAHLACEHEGHPDNVLPSIYGEMQIGALSNAEESRANCSKEFGKRSGGNFIRQHIPFPSDKICCLVYVPNSRFSTREARALLPGSYGRSVVSQSVAKASMFVAALLNGDYTNLKYAVEDSLHQPYRAPYCPSFGTLKASSDITSALAVYLSGAGPSTVILTRVEDQQRVESDLRRLCAHLFNANQGSFLRVNVSKCGVYLSSCNLHNSS